MEKLNTEFMNDNLGFHSIAEDDLEERVMKALNTDMADADRFWDADVFVQMSEWRHSVLEWYKFHSDCTILEVGAGMGALTGLLASKAKKVICLENKKSKCAILKKRFENIDNIEIVHDHYAHYETDVQFDYVIVHEISGYIKKYYGKQFSYTDYIKKVSTFLNSHGTILLFMENRLGLKYFSGSIEEYSGKFFTGLNDFDGYDYIKTFTKNEIEKMCLNSGMKYWKYYYPYPDLNFPTQIYTDEALEKIYYGGECNYINEDCFQFFDTPRMYRTLQREGTVDRFVNAYIIEISKREIMNPVLFYRNNQNDAYGTAYEVMDNLPSGIRMDMYLLNFIESVAGGFSDSIENDIEKVFSIIIKATNQISKYDKAYTVRDFYVNNDEIYMEERKGRVNNVLIGLYECYFIYDFYYNYILGRKDYEKVISLQKLCRKCSISGEKMHQLIALFEAQKSELAKFYGNKYYSNLIYPIDIYKNGDLITKSMVNERVGNSRKKQLLFEDELLGRIRR